MSDSNRWLKHKAIRHDQNRRDFMKIMGTSAVGAGALASGLWSFPAISQSRTIRIGYVTPRTGPLAPFAESDVFTIERIRRQVRGGIAIQGASHPVEIIVKDSQSNPNRAADVALELILDDEVDMVLVSSTPETTNPVSDQCELNGVPCISTVAPWEAWYFGRGATPDAGFEYTYHFFWGAGDLNNVYVDMWNTLDTNKVVGGLWPNDSDGNALSNPETGAPAVFQAAGYEVIDPGRYSNLTDDFSAQIRRFQEDGVEIFTGIPIPPDFGTFWRQAAQRRFQPKAATVAKAVLFPVAVEALGDLGRNVSTEVWWTPHHPYASSLTGQSAEELAREWEQSTERQWTQPLGFAHALFEVAVDVLQRTEDLDSPESIVQAIRDTRLSTVVGRVNWSDGPVANVSPTPLVGGQWKDGEQYRYDLHIVSNERAGEIPVQSAFEPLTY